jgi:hypothetical protein
VLEVPTGDGRFAEVTELPSPFALEVDKMLLNTVVDGLKPLEVLLVEGGDVTVVKLFPTDWLDASETLLRFIDDELIVLEDLTDVNTALLCDEIELWAPLVVVDPRFELENKELGRPLVVQVETPVVVVDNKLNCDDIGGKDVCRLLVGSFDELPLGFEVREVERRVFVVCRLGDEDVTNEDNKVFPEV